MKDVNVDDPKDGNGIPEASADEVRDAQQGVTLPLPLPENVTRLPSADRGEKLRVLEALLFAAGEAACRGTARRAHPGRRGHPRAHRGTAGLLRGARHKPRAYGRQVDISHCRRSVVLLLQRYSVEQRRLSRAALETLSIIAYHQPVTRAEIEEIRGVATSKGTLDVLLETGWIRMRGRRRAPGRPVTYGTTQGFLEHFGFDTIGDLPGLDELKGAGLLDGNLPPGFNVPHPDDDEDLGEDEDPLEDDMPSEEPTEEDCETTAGGSNALTKARTPSSRRACA